MGPQAQDPRRRVGRAWLALSFALAAHVGDEAATGFLAVYNPTVAAIREKAPWLPLPVFTFETWIAGLILGVVALCLSSAFVFRGARWTRPAGYAFAIMMAANALGHTAGMLLGESGGPMPGFYSSPLLLAASVYLFLRLRSSRAAGVQVRVLPG